MLKLKDRIFLAYYLALIITCVHHTIKFSISLLLYDQLLLF